MNKNEGINIQIKKSNLSNSGNGVFAGKDFKINEYIEIFPYLVEYKKNVKGILSNYYFNGIKYGKNKIIFPLGYGGIYNHSFKPNAKYYDLGNKKMGIVASRRIRKGEEIYISYGKKYWKTRSINPK